MSVRAEKETFSKNTLIGEKLEIIGVSETWKKYVAAMNQQYLWCLLSYRKTVGAKLKRKTRCCHMPAPVSVSVNWGQCVLACVALCTVPC